MVTDAQIQDISQRIGDPRFTRAKYAPYILRTMNRIYRRLNRELLCLEKKIVLNWGTLSDHSGDVNGNQADVNQITLDTGHDIVTNDEVWARGWSGFRTVTADAATTITIDGLPVTVQDEDEIVTLSNEWTIPSDMIEPFRIYPAMDYKDPTKFSYQEITYNRRIYTIAHGNFILGSVSSDTEVEIWYYSSGYELVDESTGNLSAGETNVAEWPWRDLHDILYYGTCIELSNDYPMYKHDLQIYINLKDRLSEAGYHKQSQTPNIIGGWGRVGIDDVYEKPGYINQG